MGAPGPLFSTTPVSGGSAVDSPLEYIGVLETVTLEQGATGPSLWILVIHRFMTKNPKYRTVQYSLDYLTCTQNHLFLPKLDLADLLQCLVSSKAASLLEILIILS